MDKELGESLHIYFNSDSYIRYLEKQVSLLDKQIDSREKKCASASCSPELIELLNNIIVDKKIFKERTLAKLSIVKEHKKSMELKLSELTDKQIQILKYRYKDGYTDKEIGAVMSLSQSGVNRIRNKVLKQIQAA